MKASHFSDQSARGAFAKPRQSNQWRVADQFCRVFGDARTLATRREAIIDIAFGFDRRISHDGPTFL